MASAAPGPWPVRAQGPSVSGPPSCEPCEAFLPGQPLSTPWMVTGILTGSPVSLDKDKGQKNTRLQPGRQEGGCCGSLQHRAACVPARALSSHLLQDCHSLRRTERAGPTASCHPSPRSSPDQSVPLPYFTGGRRSDLPTVPAQPWAGTTAGSCLSPTHGPALMGRQAGRTGQAGPRAPGSSRSHVPATAEQR